MILIHCYIPESRIVIGDLTQKHTVFVLNKVS